MLLPPILACWEDVLVAEGSPVSLTGVLSDVSQPLLYMEIILFLGDGLFTPGTLLEVPTIFSFIEQVFVEVRDFNYLITAKSRSQHGTVTPEVHI